MHELNHAPILYLVYCDKSTAHLKLLKTITLTAGVDTGFPTGWWCQPSWGVSDVDAFRQKLKKKAKKKKKKKEKKENVKTKEILLDTQMLIVYTLI